MRADSWRSQGFARFEVLGSCRAGGLDATPTLRRGATVPLHASSVRSTARTGPVTPQAENA
eukprot:872992-Pleurochrysis_carterae.AAC.1